VGEYVKKKYRQNAQPRQSPGAPDPFGGSHGPLSSPAEAFEDLTALHHTVEWDPGIVRAERLAAGPIGVGSRFRMVASFLGPV
jgi:hypothetical protein